MSRFVVAFVAILFLLSVCSIMGLVHFAKAGGTIYINADGSITPSTAPIYTADNITYTFTGGTNSEINVQRDNITVDGSGNTVQAEFGGNQYGVYLDKVSNVTIKNMTIIGFYSIWLESSSNNTISGNNITTSYGNEGIWLDSSSNGNTISGNTLVSGGLYVSDSYRNSVENNTLNGRPLVYLENASNLTVDDAGQVILLNCENITIEGLSLSKTDYGIQLLETNNSTIYGNNITSNLHSVWLNASSGNSISENNITNNEYGIWLESSSNNNSISGNNITENDAFGIQFYSSSNNNVISGNNITNNGNGISLLDSKYDNLSGNNITNNGDGVLLDIGSNLDIISGNYITDNMFRGISLGSYTNNNVISGNTITNDGNGIFLLSCSANSIFHNCFVNNTVQVMSNDSTDNWDNGYPSGGNYWSDYNDVDVNSGQYQNVTGSDGIGDTPYTIDANNKDYFPLMGTFSSFSTLQGYSVNMISNSTISDFVSPIWLEHPEIVTLAFNVTGMNGSTGFCRVSFPTVMMNGTYHVFANGTEIPYTLLPCSNASVSYLYFSYEHSTEQVIILPELPPFLILPLSLITTLLTVTIYRKKGVKTSQS
jgi:parallel beta-helix repeat protein